jgi:hypothetical protein
MYFSNYKEHKNAVINPALLWEYDLNSIDYMAMRNIVVQRVIERGWPDDWWALLNLYGEKGVRETGKSLAYLNDKDMHFVSNIFQIPLNEMECFKRKQSRPTHWNS